MAIALATSGSPGVAGAGDCSATFAIVAAPGGRTRGIAKAGRDCVGTRRPEIRHERARRLSAAARSAGFPAGRAKGNHQPACGQARPNIKGGLDDRTIARVAEQSSGARNHLAIQTSPKLSQTPRRRGRGCDVPPGPRQSSALSLARGGCSCTEGSVVPRTPRRRRPPNLGPRRPLSGLASIS
jgi:hypothetical protein